MISLVRVDDRLLHGQIICAWVPYMKADSIIVASDEAAGDSLVRDIMRACGHKGLRVEVRGIADIIHDLSSGAPDGRRAILIVATLKEAMRIYEEGLKFKTLNVGNVHHDADGRVIAPSVVLDREDEAILEKFAGFGVAVDIRDVPVSSPAGYTPGKKEDAV
ncbi:MAG: PTS sugar transporter subunit IIB [Deltaproteobacteria bacterium]|nr:PTS sugar transporter subunit IIB [Deltaproteobacteria bacterium]